MSSPTPVIAAVFYGGKNLQTDILGNKMNIITGAREHNNANILSLGARFLSIHEAKNAVKMFLETKFNGEERHVRRINKLEI
jgi:ribose 5-phosphate isomerase B